MTVSAIEPVITYSGNGSANRFDFGFLINVESELIVLHTNTDGVQTELILNTDYSITGVGNKDGGYIIFPLGSSSHSALANGEKISLVLDLPIAQQTPYGTSSGLSLPVLESSLDYLTRIVQTIKRKIDRCVKVNEGSGVSPDALIQTFYAGISASSNYAAAANASATSANTAASQSAAAASASATSAAAAANSAATLNMPAPVSGSFVVGKSDSSGFENKTIAEVRNLMDEDIFHHGNKSSAFTLLADRIQDATITGSCSATLPTETTTKFKNIIFDFTLGSGFSLSFVGNIKWAYGVAPSFSTVAGVINSVLFETRDGGATWQGAYTQFGA